MSKMKIKQKKNKKKQKNDVLDIKNWKKEKKTEKDYFSALTRTRTHKHNSPGSESHHSTNWAIRPSQNVLIVIGYM